MVSLTTPPRTNANTVDDATRNNTNKGSTVSWFEGTLDAWGVGPSTTTTSKTATNATPPAATLVSPDSTISPPSANSHYRGGGGGGSYSQASSSRRSASAPRSLLRGPFSSESWSLEYEDDQTFDDDRTFDYYDDGDGAHYHDANDTFDDVTADDTSVDHSIEATRDAGCSVTESLRLCGVHTSNSSVTSSGKRGGGRTKPHLQKSKLEQTQSHRIRQLQISNAKLLADAARLRDEADAATERVQKVVRANGGVGVGDDGGGGGGAADDPTSEYMQLRCREAERRNEELEEQILELRAVAEVQKLNLGASSPTPTQQKRGVIGNDDDSSSLATAAGKEAMSNLLRDIQELRATVQDERDAKENLQAQLVELGSRGGNGDDAEQHQRELALLQHETEALQTHHQREMGALQQQLDTALEDALEAEIELKHQIDTLQRLSNTSPVPKHGEGNNDTDDNNNNDVMEPTHHQQSRSLGRLLDHTPEDVTLLGQRDDTIAELRQRLLDYSKQLTALQEQANASEAQLAAVEPQLITLEEVRADRDEARRAIQEVQRERAAAAADHGTAMTALKATVQQLEFDVQAALGGGDARLDVEKQKTAEVQQELDDAYRAVNGLQLELEHEQSKREDVVVEMQQSIDKQSSQVTQLSATVKELEGDLQTALNGCDALDEEQQLVVELRRELEESQSTVETLRQEIGTAKSNHGLQMADSKRALDASRQELTAVAFRHGEEVTNLDKALQEVQADLDAARKGGDARLTFEQNLVEELRAERDSREASHAAQVTELQHAADSVRQELVSTESSYLQKFKSLELRIDELESDLQATVEGGDVQQEQQERVIENLRERLDASESAAQTLQMELADSQSGHATKISALQQTIQILESDLQSTRADSEAKLIAKQSIVNELTQSFAEAKFAAETLEKELHTSKAMVKSRDSVSADVDTMRAELATAQADHALRVTELTNSIVELESDLEASRTNSESNAKHLAGVIEELEEKYGTVERELLSAKLNLAAAQEEKTQQLETHTSRGLANLSAEEKKVDYGKSTAAGGSTAEDARVEVLMLEIERLNESLESQDVSRGRMEQSGGSLEEDLRKDLQSAKTTEASLRLQLEEISQERTENVNVLQKQLMDRDSSILALAKSSARLEEQIVVSKQELDGLRARLGEAGVEVVQERSSPSRSKLETLKSELAAQRQTIEDLSQNIAKITKQLRISKNDNARLKAQLVVHTKRNKLQLDRSIDTGSAAIDDEASLESSTTAQRLLKERDDAIASLVKQSFTQDKLVSDLQIEIEEVKSKAESTDESTPAAIKQLREEAEVFAGQVIELVEEIDQLKSSLENRERRIVLLEKDLANEKLNKKEDLTQVAKLRDLEAEIDELKEANLTQRDELRSLRKKSWEVDANNDALARAQSEVAAISRAADDHKRSAEEVGIAKATLLEELEAEKTARSEVETKLNEQLEKIKKSRDESVASLETQLQKSKRALEELKASPSHMKTEDVEALTVEVTNLKHNLTTQSQDVDSARKTIRELEGMLAEKSASEAAAHEEDTEELLQEIESLQHQLEEAKSRLETMEADVGIIDDFKEKLELADEAREESEQKIIETYERKLSLLTLDKDVTIDKLRNQLVVEKEANAEELQQVTNQLKDYQVEISDLRDEMAEQLGQREAHIVGLEQTLTAQEQLVSNMGSEMDHLQGSMEGSAARRKEEIDEMQQEILTVTAASQKQEREIETLKVELESVSASHQSEVDKLQSRIVELESNPEEHRNAADLQMELRVKEVKDRLEKLKWRNTSLREENINLKERLEQAVAVSKETEYPERMKELEEELSKQIQKVKSLETSLKSAKEPPADSTPKPVSSAPTKSGATKKAATGKAKVATKPPMPAKSTKSAASATASAMAAVADSKEKSSGGRRLGRFLRKNTKGTSSVGSASSGTSSATEKTANPSTK